MNDGRAARDEPGSTRVPREPEAGRTTFDWPRHAGATGAVLQELEVQLRLRRRRRNRRRGAASAVLVLLTMGWIWRSPLLSPPAAPAVASATASVPDRQVLPDGSVVLLRAGAEVSVEYSAAVRRVRLQRGEALFEVAKNSARPFIVRAAGLDVRAVGTAFAVNLHHSAVEVLVTEGQVAVQETSETSSPPDDSMDGAIESDETRPTATPGSSSTDIAPRFPAWMLNAGKRIVVDFDTSAPPPQVVPISAAEMNERLSWRVPRLQFARTPLRDGVALINQYSRTRLILEGTELENLPLSGSIRADNIAALLELLELEYGIRAEHRSETEIVLREAP